MINVDNILNKLTSWVKEYDDIQAVGYVGSYARGSAHESSDLDLMFIVNDPAKYLKDHKWLSHFGEVKEVKNEDWGLVQTLRVFFQNGDEIEFNFTTSDWAKTEPVDEGTRKVVSDGMKIIYDPQGILQNLLHAVNTA